MVINGVSSDFHDINASVPQGSILGPLLFLCYVNDLVDGLETTPYLFADDTSIFCEIDPINPDISFGKINRDLAKLSTWANQWRVTYNANKTVYMIVSNKKTLLNYPPLVLNNQVITRVYEHICSKHLGIILTHNMKWDTGTYCREPPAKGLRKFDGERTV